MVQGDIRKSVLISVLMTVIVRITNKLHYVVVYYVFLVIS